MTTDNESKYKQITECKLTIAEKWCNSFPVMYPTSIDYNGGFVEYTYKNGKTSNYYIPNEKPVSSEHYKGFRVTVSPKVPEGYKLTSIYCGLQMNAMPPLRTAYLEPLDGKKKSKKEVKTAIETANK